MISTQKIDKNIGFFRFSKFEEDYLLTNDCGEYIFLTDKQFDNFIQGKIEKKSPLYKELLNKNFYNTEKSKDKLIEKYKKRNSYLASGPHLHIVIPTLRCNQHCVYCHASRKNINDKKYDMDKPVAKKVVDTIFETTSPFIIIEFQGGEPLANFDLIKFIVDYSLEVNHKKHKEVGFSIVSNLSLANESIIKYLIERNVMICTSLDGPTKIHNNNRKHKGGDSYKETVRWIKEINEQYRAKSLDESLYHVDALMTTTKQTLPYWKEVIDEYVKLGIKAIHIRPLNPFGMAKKVWNKIGYSADDFVDFYKKALDYIIELNLKGVEILERTAAIFLTKIITEEDPNFLDVRSPCGAGIGQVAYNYDGKIFTCDEGRMLYQMGDDNFQIGEINKDDYSDLIGSDIVTSLSAASCLDCIPACSDCAFKPYCGTCPVYNYAEQGDIFGQMPTNDRCKINKQILTCLFKIIRNSNSTLLEHLHNWTINKRPFLYTH